MLPLFVSGFKNLADLAVRLFGGVDLPRKEQLLEGKHVVARDEMPCRENGKTNTGSDSKGTPKLNPLLPKLKKLEESAWAHDCNGEPVLRALGPNGAQQAS